MLSLGDRGHATKDDSIGLFPRARRARSRTMVCLLWAAACAACGNEAAGEITRDEMSIGAGADDDPSGTDDAVNDAAQNEAADTEQNGEATEERLDEHDAGTAAEAPNLVAVDGAPASAPRVCAGDTPHGCYTLAPDQHAGCPQQIPEIRTLYPFNLGKWDRCSHGAVRPYAICRYTGPDRARGACICDTGLHWICLYY